MASDNEQQSSAINKEWLHQKQKQLQELLASQLECKQKKQLLQKMYQEQLLRQQHLMNPEQFHWQRQQLQRLHELKMQQQQQKDLDTELRLQELHDKIAMAYAIAVKKGMGVANQFKLVMLGAEGAGKTSTVKSLIDKDFQPQLLVQASVTRAL